MCAQYCSLQGPGPSEIYLYDNFVGPRTCFGDLEEAKTNLGQKMGGGGRLFSLPVNCQSFYEIWGRDCLYDCSSTCKSKAEKELIIPSWPACNTYETTLGAVWDLVPIPA